MQWTDEMLNFAKSLWAEGGTGSEVAAAMNAKFGCAMTRSAVIGKINRTGNAGRIVVARTQNPPKPTNPPKPKKEKPTMPEAVVIPFPRVPVVCEAVERPAHVVSLMRLRVRSCRFPFGDPGEDGFGFCGQETPVGASYCVDHMRIVYRGAPRVQSDESNEKRRLAALKLGIRQF